MKRMAHLLVELFTKEGRGTLLSNDKLEELRTAGIHDVGGILNLIRPLEEAGVLVRAFSRFAGDGNLKFYGG